MMTTMRRMAPASTTITLSSAALLGALAISACKPKTDAEAANAPAAVQMIGPDNVAVAGTDTLRTGPAISGTLTADREARIRAEVAGAILQVYVDAGQRVAAGTPLARVDDAVLQDAAASARSGVTTATLAAEQAAREFGRAKTLVAAGAIAERDVEAAERANVAAQAQLADAKARAAAAEKNVANATVRAPFAGVVAEKSVSPGDIVAPGAPMFTVIDPRSLKLDASVPTTALGDVRVGSTVTFSVNGSDRQLEGRVTRISPMVDPATRQVGLRATVPNAENALVAGLYVSGRVAVEKRLGVMVPERAVDQTGVSPFVMRLKGGKVERVAVQLGVRDEGAEALEIKAGLAAGDTVLLGAARGISVGSSVGVSAPTDGTPAATSAAPAKNE